MDDHTRPMLDELAWRESVDEQLDAIREQLRSVNDRLALILEILIPKETDGPTLDDLLARVVTLIAEQRPILRRIDSTTGQSLDLLEGRPTRPRSTEEAEGDREGADGE